MFFKMILKTFKGAQALMTEFQFCAIELILQLLLD